MPGKKKSPVKPGTPFLSLCLGSRSAESLQTWIGQVFRLPDRSTHRPSRRLTTVVSRLLSPVTAAGPQRIFTVFPILSLPGQPYPLSLLNNTCYQ